MIHFDVVINIDSYKVEHKKKFYKDLHNDLMVVAWHPKRVVDWCYDIEEQEIFNSLPKINLNFFNLCYIT